MSQRLKFPICYPSVRLVVEPNEAVGKLLAHTGL